MKRNSLIMLCFFLAFVVFFGCKKDDDTPEPPAKSIVPGNITIDIPDAVSAPSSKKSSKSDTLHGNEIYNLQRVFIYAGEMSAKIVGDIITAISVHGINKPMSLDYTGDDGYSKHLEVVANPSFESITWEYGLTVTDNTTDSTAMQVFWNRSPKKGITVISVKAANQNETQHPNARIRVDYSEAETAYDKQMTVYITGLTMVSINDINNMKMFVGKNGNLLDIYGNSNHPTAIIVDPNHTGGRNWAFVAHADDNLNIGVVKVGLPPCTVTSTDSIFTSYSMYNVLKDEINAIGITDSLLIAVYLQYAQAPGYFESPDGFVSCGSNIPSNAGFTTSFCDLSGLTPYVPADINNLVISFKP